MRFSELSIQRKLLVAKLVPLLVAINLIVAVVLFLGYYAQQRWIKEEMLVLSEVLAAQSVASVVFKDNKSAYQDLMVLAVQERVSYACLYSDISQGKLADYDPGDRYNAEHPCPQSEEIHYERDGSWATVHQPVTMNDQLIGSLYFEINLEQDNSLFLRYFLTLVLSTLLSGILAYRLMTRWQKHIYEPAVAQEETITSGFASSKGHSDSAVNVPPKGEYFDELTALPNARMFEDRLTKVLSLAKRKGILIGVVYVELLNLREISIRLGAQAEEEIITGAVACLNNEMRESDTLARLADRKFAAILIDIEDEKAAALVIERMLNKLQQPRSLRGGAIKLNVKIAVNVTAGELDVASLMQQSEASLVSR